MAKPKILVCDSLAEAGLEILREAGDVVVATELDEIGLIAAVADVDAIVVRSGTRVTAPVIGNAAHLQVIARAGIGVDNIDIPAATRCGVIVVNSPAGNTLAAAEHTIALMLAIARRIPQAAASLKAGEWDRKSYTGRQLCDKTLGLVGFGKVGSEVAKRALAFGMRVLAHDPYVSVEQVEAAGAQLVENLDELVARADFLSLHCVLTADTEHIINAELLARMKPDAVLINCARGKLVDEEALLAALTNGTIAAAALDVFADEPTGNRRLLELPNLIATPHVGAATEEAQASVAVDAARQVADVLAGQLPRWPVNAAALSPEALAALDPYVDLVTKLGVLGRGLMAGAPRRIELVAATDVAGEHLPYLTGRLLVAVLQGIVDGTLNFVNASSVARERGIEIAQTRIDQRGGYAQLLEVRVTTAKDEFRVAGALFDRSEVRIVRLDGYQLDLVPRGLVVLIWNSESGKPGFVGSLGGLLGSAGINITGIQVAAQSVSGVGLMSVTVSDSISAQVRDRISSLPGVQRVEIVDMDIA